MDRAVADAKKKNRTLGGEFGYHPLKFGVFEFYTIRFKIWTLSSKVWRCLDLHH